MQHQLARIYILTGEPDLALDRLEPLLQMLYYLTPGWLSFAYLLTDTPNLPVVSGYAVPPSPCAIPFTVSSSAPNSSSSSRPPARHARSRSICRKLIGST